MNLKQAAMTHSFAVEPSPASLWPHKEALLLHWAQRPQIRGSGEICSTILSGSNILGLMSQKNEHSAKHGLLNVLFNVIIPVLILNKGSTKLGAGLALGIALAFPLSYGLYDLISKKKWNPLSLLGFLNVSVTGTLALLGLGGIWFSIKEAFFPFLIGAFVWWSAGRKNPLIKTFLLNPQTMQVDRIEQALKEKNKEPEFDLHIRQSTRFLSFSFFLSAVLNFALAQVIFTPLDVSMTHGEKSLLLNQQIAQMTTWSAVIIVIPSTIFLIFILWHLLKGIRDLTGLQNEEILKG